MPSIADFIKWLFGSGKTAEGTGKYKGKNFTWEPVQVSKETKVPIQKAAKSAGRLQNYIAFDLEIAKVFEGDFSQWKAHRPLGITCAATLINGSERRLWFSQTEDGDFADKMRREDAAKLVNYLDEMARAGYQIITWNGLGFDFDVLAEESGCWETCRNLALSHVDMMFHIFCLQGYPLSLNKAAKGMGLAGKTEGMTGDLAPILWQQGHQPEVLEYVAQDVRTTLDVAKSVDWKGSLQWSSNSGRSQQVSFPDGWRIVNQVIPLPLPNTSWMTDPMKREGFYQWTQLYQAPKCSEDRSPDQPAKPVETFTQLRQTKPTVSETELSEVEINVLFSKCDSNSPGVDESYFQIAQTYYENFGDEEIRSIEPLKPNHEPFRCPCPVCAGAPNLDHIFLDIEFASKKDHERNDYYDEYDK